MSRRREKFSTRCPDVKGINSKLENVRNFVAKFLLGNLDELNSKNKHRNLAVTRSRELDDNQTSTLTPGDALEKVQ